MHDPNDVNRPSPTRRLGDGYEPHVDDVAGRLTYSLPVDSGFVSLSFSFEISETDLSVLLADPYRRALLEVASHTVLQRSMIRGNPPVTPADFRQIVNRTLHAAPDGVATFVAEVGREHNIDIDRYVRSAMSRRPVPPVPGEAPSDPQKGEHLTLSTCLRPRRGCAGSAR